MNIKKFVTTLDQELAKHAAELQDTETPTQVFGRLRAAVGVAKTAAAPRSTKVGRTIPRIPKSPKPDKKK